MNRRIKEIDYVRAIAIISVVSIHIASMYVWETKTQFPYTEFYILRNIPSFAVPLFIMVSGLLITMIYKNNRLNYLSFLKKRITYIFIPFLLWSIIYLFFTGEYRSMSVGQTLQHILLGKFVHLYFVPIILQFYLLFPVFLFLVKKLKSPIWLIILLMVQVWLNGKIQFVIPEVSNFFGTTLFLRWAFISFLGCYIGYNYEMFREVINRYANAIIALTGCVILYKLGVVYHFTVNKGFNFISFAPIVTVENIIYTLLVFCLIVHFAQYVKLNGNIDKILTLIALNSFGIYLSHILFIRILNLFYRNGYLPGINDLVILFSLILITIVSLLFTMIINRLPKGYLLIGKNK